MHCSTQIRNLDPEETGEEISEEFRNMVLQNNKNINWMDMLTNEEVSGRVDKERSILDIVVWRKANWIRHP